MASNNYNTHLTVLEKSAACHPSAAAFQIPRSPFSTSNVHDWQPVTYWDFQQDVLRFSKYWARLLRQASIPQRSVIGLWLGGTTYTDVLHIYGMSRAGFIPQLFSLRLPSPDVVYELLKKADAKALIYDPSYASIVKGCPVPAYVAAPSEEVDASDERLPTLPVIKDGNEKVFVFHTSGSTSGSPKLVPCSYTWLHAIVHKTGQVARPKDPKRQDVAVWMGSMCHIGQSCMLLGSLQYGSCMIQPSKIAFSSTELVNMVHKCQLNRLNQFATFLATHIRTARHDKKLLTILQNMDEIFYSGLPLNRDEAEFAYRNGLILQNGFGSTECAIMLLSKNEKGCGPPPYQPLDGVSYGFFPIDTVTPSEACHKLPGQLVELVILAESPDCPDASLRGPDGHYHTGDLFLKVPGGYLSRGRNDDWIKSENSLRCDTKAIEDNVNQTCANLVQECIVVGSGRPSPALFIEAAPECSDHHQLKKEILRRTRQFHSRRYLHERITSPDLIIVVSPGSLPRTASKGNIRRQAVEQLYKEQLDRIYETIPRS